MSTTALQRRRGDTAAHSIFVGLPGETTVDVTKNTVVVHDGATVGGFPLAHESVLNAHIADTDNPHEVTKTQIGLSAVDNVSDLDKPISTATQAALDGKQGTLTMGVFGTSVLSADTKEEVQSLLELDSAAFYPASAFINDTLSAISEGVYAANTLIHVNSALEFEGVPVTELGLVILTTVGSLTIPVEWTCLLGVTIDITTLLPGSIQFADSITGVASINLKSPLSPPELSGATWDVYMPDTTGTLALEEEVTAEINIAITSLSADTISAIQNSVVNAVQFTALTSLSSEDIPVQVPAGCNMYTAFILIEDVFVNRRVVLDTSAGTPGAYIKLKYFLPATSGIDVSVVNTAEDLLDILTTDSSGENAVAEFVKTDTDWAHYSGQYPA